MEKVKIWEVEVTKSITSSLVIGVASFVILTAFGAWVKIPIPGTPVPITLQTMFVLLGGAILGIYGGVAQLIYVILGTLGLPIFACSGQVQALPLLGPTGGYLIGFIVAAPVVGVLVRCRICARGESFGWIIFSMIIGTLIIYLFGILQLGLFLSQSGFKGVIALGVLPFIPGDTIKLLIASTIYCKFHSRFSHIFG